MEVTMQNGSRDTVLSKAILIYESGRNGYQREASFASIHDVMNTGTVARPDVQIMPGSPVTQQALMNVMGKLADKYLLNTDLLPENILAFSPRHMMWWRPAGHSPVFFNNKELGKKSASVPHPALLFMVVEGTWSVWALSESRRPTLSTPLFHAPYFNVYDDGRICVGSASIPDRLSPSTIPTWESAFFDSEFTHVNGQKKKIAHVNGEYAFWKEMLNGAYQEFPLDLLVPMNITVVNAMTDMRNRLGVNNG